jgi:hypothetical protein
MAEFDHKPRLPWFDHFVVKLTVVAGNDVKLKPCVDQPMFSVWSLQFQEGGVRMFSAVLLLAIAQGCFPTIL